MLLTVLQHTPIWVYILLVILILLGIQQSRTRQISRTRLLTLPFAMMILSLYAVISAFGINVLPLLCWISGLAITTLVMQRLYPDRLQYCEATQLFTVPGSWTPLALMMGIFLMKYCVGVTLARVPEITTETVFIFTVSTMNGVFSGLFLTRLGSLLRRRQPRTKKPA